MTSYGRRRLRVLGLALLPVLAALAACGSADTPPPAPLGRTGVGRTQQVALAGRPFALHVPASYRPGTAVALVVLLHGYTASGAKQERYFGLTAESDRRGFLYAMPDGTTDSRGNTFWNATDGCCNFFGSTVDDSMYLSQLIRTVQNQYTVDSKRVYLVGHSNGAFMAFRMACDHADQITAIATLNGAMWTDVSKCRPSRPVSLLDLRATADDTIRYAGGSNAGHPYPSAARTDADWVALDHCKAPPTTGARLDVATDVTGAETTVRSYGACAGNSTVATWTIEGGSHVPPLSPAFAPAVMDFLSARVAP